MRNKTLVQTKIERIEATLRNINYSIGRNERSESYKALDKVTDLLSQINTLLNTETQD